MKIDRKAFLRIFLLFVIEVAALGIWMWAVRQAFPGLPATITSDLYKGVQVESNPWLEPWQRWDTPQYQAIAERGYGAFDTALFTPPLFPFLMRLLSPITGGNTLASGLLVSGIAFLASLIAIYQTALLESGDEKTAFRTSLYLASFPAALFLVAAYSESIFLLGAVLSLYSARKGRWLAAGLWGAVAAVTRIPGAALVVPLAFAAWQAWHKGEARAWLTPLVAGLGAAIFPLYVWIGLGQFPTAILDSLNARGGHLTIPGWNIVEAISRILHGQLVEENLIELVFTLLFLVLTVYIWKKLPRIYGIYSVTLMLLYLSRIGSPQPLVSMARYVIEIFPAFLVLADWGRRPMVQRVILYLSWLGLLFFAAQFAIWGWVG
jgi:Gpi18-like mannosyltransferase